MDISDRNVLNRLYRYCYALYGNEHDAYDLLQSSLEKYLAKPPKNTGAALAYMKTIIRRTYIDQARRDKRLSFESVDTSTLVDINSTNLEDIFIASSEFEAAWRSLTEQERELLYLWAVEELTVSEIAKHIKRPRGTILSIMHRMRKRIQENTASEDEKIQYE